MKNIDVKNNTVLFFLALKELAGGMLSFCLPFTSFFSLSLSGFFSKQEQLLHGCRAGKQDTWGRLKNKKPLSMHSLIKCFDSCPLPISHVGRLQLTINKPTLFVKCLCFKKTPFSFKTQLFWANKPALLNVHLPAEQPPRTRSGREAQPWTPAPRSIPKPPSLRSWLALSPCFLSPNGLQQPYDMWANQLIQWQFPPMTTWVAL